MKKWLVFFSVIFLLLACNSGTGKKSDSEKDSNFYYYIDSALTEPPTSADSVDVSDTRGLGSGDENPKRDNMKDSLKVKFPDKRK